MTDVVQRLLADCVNRSIVWLVAAVYLAAYQLALGDLIFDGVVRPVAATVVPDWAAMILRERVAFQFEAVAIIELPFAVWLISPMNLLVGGLLGLMTGAQIALVRIARQCASACGLSPVPGLLAGLPGLLAGSACCAPLLFLLLGVQATTALISAMGFLVPLAFVFLTVGLAITLRVAGRHCREAAP